MSFFKKNMIVAFGKISGVGKDTAGEYLSKKFKEPIPIFKFAKGVREALEILTGVPIDKTWTTKEKEKSLKGILFTPDEMMQSISNMINQMTCKKPDVKLVCQFFHKLSPTVMNGLLFFDYTIGKALQILGTDCFRNLIDEDFWVKRLLPQLLYDGKPIRAIITDLRFPNEAKSLSEIGALLVEITRNSESQNLAGRDELHSSEKQEFPVDIHITNNGSMQEFYEVLEKQVLVKLKW